VLPAPCVISLTGRTPALSATGHALISAATLCTASIKNPTLIVGSRTATPSPLTLVSAGVTPLVIGEVGVAGRYFPPFPQLVIDRVKIALKI
jgi:hypothetical protein